MLTLFLNLRLHVHLYVLRMLFCECLLHSESLYRSHADGNCSLCMLNRDTYRNGGRRNRQPQQPQFAAVDKQWYCSGRLQKQQKRHASSDDPEMQGDVSPTLCYGVDSNTVGQMFRRRIYTCCDCRSPMRRKSLNNRQVTVDHLQVDPKRIMGNANLNCIKQLSVPRYQMKSHREMCTALSYVGWTVNVGASPARLRFRRA